MMLDRDLAQLAAVAPEVALVGLEQAIWSKVEAMQRVRRFERLTSCVQAVALVVVLIASTTIGMAISHSRASRPEAMQISLVSTDLAPSTLLGLQR